MGLPPVDLVGKNHGVANHTIGCQLKYKTYIYNNHFAGGEITYGVFKIRLSGSWSALTIL